jgi:hypothetical protein
MLPAPDARGYRRGDRSVWFDGYDLCRFIAPLYAAHGVALIDTRGSRRYTTLFFQLYDFIFNQQRAKSKSLALVNSAATRP